MALSLFVGHSFIVAFSSVAFRRGDMDTLPPSFFTVDIYFVHDLSFCAWGNASSEFSCMYV
jgi:hypothetical protein